MSRADKFIQPADGVHIISKGDGGTWLTPETLEEGRRRVAAGEDPEKVALELAQLEVELLYPDLDVLEEEFRKETGYRGAEFNPDQPRDEQGQWTDTGAKGFPSGTRKQSSGLDVVRARTKTKAALDFSIGESALRGLPISKIDKLEESGEISKKRADDFRMLRSIYDYKDGKTAFELNKKLRSGKSLTAEEELIIDAQKRLEVDLPKMVLYRGLKSEAIDIEKLGVGRRLTMKGLISTSADPKVALQFASKKDPILFEIKAKRGSFFSGVAKDSLTEKEVVLAHNSSFNIVGLTRNKDGIRFVQLEQR